jgi:phage-related protein
MLPKISDDIMKVYVARIKAYIMDAMKQVKGFAKDGAEFTTDAMLRGVHAGLKRTAEIEQTVRKGVQTLRESVKINIDEKGLNVDISHLDIEPSFKALLNQSKAILTKALRESMQQAEFLLRQARTDISILKMTAAAYAKMAREQAPIVVGKAVKVIKDETAALRTILEKYMTEFKEKWDKEYPVLVAKITKIVEALKKEIATLNTLVAEKVPALVSDIKKMVQNELARAVNIKDFGIAMMDKASQKLKEVMQRVSKSKIYIKFITLVEQKLTGLKNFIAERIQAIITDPTFIKVRSDVQTLIARTLSDLKQRTEDLAKIVANQATLLKENVAKYVETIKEQYPVILGKIVEYIKVQIAESEKLLSSFPEKLDELMKQITKAITDFVDKVMKNKRFVESVEYIKKQIGELKTMIEKAVEDIKTNPTLNKMMQELLNMTMKAIETLKKKSTILVEEMEKLIALTKTEVERLIKIIREEAPVMVEKVIKFMKEQLVKVEEQIRSAVGDLESIVRKIFAEVINFSKKTVEELIKLVNQKIAELKKNPTLIKITNEIKNATLTIIAELKTKIPEIAKTLEDTVAYLEKTLKEYIIVIREKAPAMIKQISKMIKDTVSKVKTTIRSTIVVVERKLKEIYNFIVSSKSFKDIVQFAKKQIAAIESFLEKQLKLIKQQIEQLKKNPMLIKIKNFIIAAMKDLNRNVEKAMEMVRKEIASLKSKVTAYVRILRQQVSALVKQVKDQFQAVKAFIKSVIESLPAKINELKQMFIKTWNETTAKVKKMINDIIEKILSSDVYKKMVEYKMKLQEVAKELIAQVKTLIEKLKIDTTLKALQEKVVEFIKNAQRVIKEEIQVVQKQIPAIMEKIQTAIKANIELVKKELPALIKKIEKLIKDFFLKSEEFAKASFVQLVESEQVTQLIKMLEQLRDFVRDNVNEILTNPSVIRLRERVDTIVKQTLYFRNRFLQVLKTEVPAMWSEVKGLLQFAYRTLLEKYSDIIKALETSEPIAIIMRTLSELLKTMEDQLKVLGMWARKQMAEIQRNPMYSKMMKMAGEVRGDLKRSYGANSNVTMRLVEDVQMVLTPYMTQGVNLYVQMYQQLLSISQKLRQLPGYFAEQVAQIYKDASDASDFLMNAPFDQISARMMEYTKKLYSSLMMMIDNLYKNAKSVSGTIGKDTVDAVIGALNAMEQKLVPFAKMIQAVMDTIKKIIENIRSGENAEEQVRTMMQKLLGKLDLSSIVDQLCAKDAKLCELVQESVSVHKELVEKYLIEL